MRKCLLPFALLLTGSTTAWCGLTVTAANPGVQTTAVAGATTFTFDSLPLGLQNNVPATFGTITGTYNPLYIRTPDIYGGSNASKYPVAAVAYGTGSYTLQLSGAVNYFGMHWLAGDPSNQVDFYLGNTLVASFTTATALGVLPNTYLGNPNGGTDAGEAFAYLNFFGTGGTTFDRIVFTVTNNVGGFESDNHSIAVNASPSGGLLITGTLPPTSTAQGAPALSEWMVFALALLLGVSGVLLLRRHGVARGA